VEENATHVVSYPVRALAGPAPSAEPRQTLSSLGERAGGVTLDASPSFMATDQFASFLEAADPVAAHSRLLGAELRAQMQSNTWISLSSSEDGN
jgi:hypothetical protein